MILALTSIWALKALVYDTRVFPPGFLAFRQGSDRCQLGVQLSCLYVSRIKLRVSEQPCCCFYGTIAYS